MYVRRPAAPASSTLHSGQLALVAVSRPQVLSAAVPSEEVPCLCRIDVVNPDGITMAMWAKRRQRRPPFLSILTNRVPPS